MYYDHDVNKDEINVKLTNYEFAKITIRRIDVIKKKKKNLYLFAIRTIIKNFLSSSYYTAVTTRLLFAQ